MRHSSDLSGIVAMLVATGFFVVGDSIIKLATEELPPFEVLFLRSVVASLACAVLVVLRGEWRFMSGLLDRRALLRGGGETLCSLCYVVALARLPIADVIAILQTTPLLVILGAALLLRERIGSARLGLALVGFAGAVMVAQPDAEGVSPAVLLAFAAALTGAVRDVAGRSLPSRVPVMVVIFATMLTLAVAAGSMSLAVETWTAPNPGQLASVAFAGLLVTFGHVGLMLAFRLGRTASVAPFYYAFALWGVIAGLAIWGTLPNLLALAGIALIAGSGIAIVMLDQRRSRPAEADQTH